MDNISLLTKSSVASQSQSDDGDSNLNILAKLKRLKIQKNILLQSLCKCTPTSYHIDNENVDGDYRYISDFKSFAAKVKDGYHDVKTQFADVKANTDSQEVLQQIDINDLKTNILEVENKIKSLKIYLQTELASLKQQERELNEHINDSPTEIIRINRQKKIQTATFNEIVPSPVRVYMNSPFKCLEIQQFHEFMSNSPNRYGGWNEYHHNIFVKILKKHFKLDSEYLIAINEQTETFNLFMQELLHKLQGIKEDNIISHCKWYSNYIYLKERKQRAIDEWKSNKLLIKKSLQKAQVNKWERKCESPRNVTFNIYGTKNKEESTDEVHTAYYPGGKHSASTSSEALTRGLETIPHETNSKKSSGNQCRTINYIKPTKQWISRCNTIDNNNYPHESISNLEHITKLRIPKWRIFL